MTDLLRSIMQTAHNAQVAAPPAVKTEAQPLDAIQVPPSACTAGVTAEAQRVIKLEAASDAATNIPADAGKAQRAARRDVVNARRETKRKTMGDGTEVAAMAVAATATASAVVDMTTESAEKSKKMKTSKTTSVNVSAAADADVKAAKKDAALLFGADIDALGEERLRAMEAQLESLDPDSKEAKKKRRLIRNRMSAQLHRERKKAYVGQLEDQLMEKERELKALQEKMNAIVLENSKMKQKLEVHTPAVAATPVVPKPAAAPATIVQIEDDVAIKTEPMTDVASAFDASLAAAAAALSKDNWADCFPNLEDSEMADIGAEELLRDLDHPFAAYTAALMNKPQEQMQSHHEIHAAKKNFVMMMGMMFSATVFGNSPNLFDVQNGSKFQSFFDANAPKEFPQLNIASKIMSTLEKASWKDFRDISSWTTAMDAKTADVDSDDEDEDEEKAQVGVDAAVDGEEKEELQDTEMETAAAASSPDSFASSPSPSLSAASDMTDSSESCDSPGRHDVDDCLALTGFETDLIDEFEYPVDDPFAPTLADMKWFGDETVDFGNLDEAKDTVADVDAPPSL